MFGEMLWVPTLQAIVVDRAPAAQRGAYMGAFNATCGAAFALAPLVGLKVLGRFGDEAMWAVMAGLAVLGSSCSRSCCANTAYDFKRLRTRLSVPIFVLR